MLNLQRHYEYLFKELSDPRLQNWLFMADPLPMLAILIVYFYAIYVHIPRFMENRKPFTLRKLLVVYNAAQVVANLALFYGVLTSGWTTYYSWSCQLPDFTQNPPAMRMLAMCWWGLLLKMADLLETVFFALRKKHNQVSALHVYHHSSTLVLCWIVTKYHGGGSVTITALINTIIHVLMYTYYLVSLFGSRTKLLKWKRLMTTAQLVQLVFFLAYLVNAMRVGCQIPAFILFLGVPDVLIVIAFFCNFYMVNYSAGTKRGVKTR